MSERFKNATKQHLINEITKLENQLEELRVNNNILCQRDNIRYELEQLHFYKGLVNGYENVLEVVKMYIGARYVNEEEE